MRRSAVLLGAGLCALLAAAEGTDPVLTDLDRAFDPCFAWWGEVYDPASGGCFYALSGKAAAAAGEAGFGPDIEATSKLVHILEWTGLMERTTPAFRAGAVRYMQERQDPATGFFRDPGRPYSANTLDRALGMALGVLRTCGGEARHPLPQERLGENTEAAEHYAHLASPEAMRAWVEALPWETRAWTTGANILSQRGALSRVDAEHRAALIAVIVDIVTARQGEDGYIGTDSWESRLSGTYKIISFFEQQGLPIPRRDAILSTLLADLDGRDYRNLIVLYNTANLFGILYRAGADLDLDHRRAIVRRCTAILSGFHAPGGGFCTVRGKPAPEANGKVLGKAVVEGNTNATGLAHKMRSILHQLIDGADIPRPHPRGADLLSALAR